MDDSKNFGASGLALLVNESRARRPDLSLDRFAGLWTDPSNAGQVKDLWNAFAREVYPHDDIVLSVRNRFMTEQIAFFEAKYKGINFINICSGYTSYCYDLNEKSTIVETDLLDVVNYKNCREKEFIRLNLIDNIEIERIAFDINLDRFDSISNIFKSTKKTVVILEGISYYLNNKKWTELLKHICDFLKPGDLFIFDYWRFEDRNRDVFARYLNFCRSKFNLTVSTFNFLTVSEADLATFGLELVKLSNVAVEERRFGGCALNLADDDVMPEWYAICRVLD